MKSWKQTWRQLSFLCIFEPESLLDGESFALQRLPSFLFVSESLKEGFSPWLGY